MERGHRDLRDDRQRGNAVTKKKDVYHAVRNVELNGIKLERRDGATGYNRALTVRSARGVTLRNCTIYGGETYASGNTTKTAGAIIDFYGDYYDVSLVGCTVEGEAGIDIRDLCNHVGNISASMQVDDDYPTGGRKVLISGCKVTTHNFDEGLPIFAGNEQGLKNAQGEEYPILKNCLVEDVTVEHNTYTMLQPQTDKQRVVSITCGYQDSPVRNVHIEHNTFDVYANSYLILFGWAESCVFAHNDCTLRSTKKKLTIVPVIRSTHSRTGPTANVRVEDNEMKFPDENAVIARMVDTALGAGAVTFAGNDVTAAGTVERVFDSTAASTGNTFHLNYVKHLYDRVGEVSGNTYDIATLENLYESYSTDAQVDLDIRDETATIGLLKSKYLLTLNGTPKYNGHAITFSNCSYTAAETAESGHRVAYDASSVEDGMELVFAGCEISWFEGEQNYAVSRDGANKVSIEVLDEPIARDDPQEYAIVLNADGTWSGAEAGHTFSSNADFSKFVCVLVDGAVLVSSAYDVVSGSTKVTLHADYLSTLAAGVHTATIRSTDGEASTTFTVQESQGGEAGSGETTGGGEAGSGDTTGGGEAGGGETPGAGDAGGGETPGTGRTGGSSSAGAAGTAATGSNGKAAVQSATPATGDPFTAAVVLLPVLFLSVLLAYAMRASKRNAS